MSAEQTYYDPERWEPDLEAFSEGEFETFGLGALSELYTIGGTDCEVPHFDDKFYSHLLSCNETDDGHHSSIRRVRMPKSEFLVTHTHSQAALETSDAPHIILLPGITQRLDKTRLVNTSLSNRYPDSVVTTLGSNAIDINNAHDNATIEEASTDRFNYLGEIVPEGQPVILVATSQGAAYANAMLNMNTAASRQLDIQGAVYFVPALVTPERKKPTSDVHFLGKLAVSSVKELFRHKFGERVEVLGDFSGLVVDSLQQIQPILHQARELQKGTPLSEIESAAEHYRLRVIRAENDSLAEDAMWRELSAIYPELHDTVLANVGHDVAYYHDPTISAVSVAIDSLLLRTRGVRRLRAA